MRLPSCNAPGQIFALTLTELEGLRFPADAAQFIFDGKARRAADEEWGKDCAARRDDPHAWMPGVSRAAERDLRSAAGVVGSRSRATAVAAVDRSRGHASSFSVWHGCCGDAVARSCCSPPDHCERHGSRYRHLRAQGRACRAHAHHRRLGNRHRRGLSQGEQETGRRHSSLREEPS